MFRAIEQELAAALETSGDKWCCYNPTLIPLGQQYSSRKPSEGGKEHEGEKGWREATEKEQVKGRLSLL